MLSSVLETYPEGVLGSRASFMKKCDRQAVPAIWQGAYHPLPVGLNYKGPDVHHPFECVAKGEFAGACRLSGLARMTPNPIKTPCRWYG